MSNYMNKTTLTGTIESAFVYSHEFEGEKFYRVFVSSKRISNTEDIIPVIFSDRIINPEENYIGWRISINGQFRSHDHESGKLILYVFVQDYEWLNDDDPKNINDICLEGYVCKPPIYRKTPLGRQIADILLAVNRPYGKSDYLPCICWGRNAIYAEGLDVGAHLILDGRIQSREYIKAATVEEALKKNESEKRIAYEVSVKTLRSA